MNSPANGIRGWVDESGSRVPAHLRKQNYEKQQSEARALSLSAASSSSAAPGEGAVSSQSSQEPNRQLSAKEKGAIKSLELISKIDALQSPIPDGLPEKERLLAQGIMEKLIPSLVAGFEVSHFKPLKYAVCGADENGDSLLSDRRFIRGLLKESGIDVSSVIVTVTNTVGKESRDDVGNLVKETSTHIQIMNVQGVRLISYTLISGVLYPQL